MNEQGSLLLMTTMERRCLCSYIPVQEERPVYCQNSSRETSCMRYQDCAKGGSINHYASATGSTHFLFTHSIQILIKKSSSLNNHSNHSEIKNIRVNQHKWTPGDIKGTLNKSSTSVIKKMVWIFSNIFINHSELQHFVLGHKMLLYICNVKKVNWYFSIENTNQT